MAGISEAPIKLKVVGVTRLPRLPKRKSPKSPTKSSSKYRKLNQTTATTNTTSEKENQILQKIPPPLINKPQTALELVSKVFPVDKRHKMNIPDAKKKTSIKSTPKPPENSTALLSESLI